MKRNIQPNKLILFSIAFSVAFIAGGLILYFNTEQIISKSQATSQEAVASFHLHNRVQKIVRNVISIESRIRGYVISGDTNFIRGITDTVERLRSELAGIQEANLPGDDKAPFTLLASLINKRLNNSIEVLTIYERFGKEEAEKRISSKAEMILRDSIRDLTQKIEKELNDRLQSGIEDNRKRATFVLHASRLLTILELTGIVILSLLVVRHVLHLQRLIAALKEANEKEVEARRNIEKISAEIQDLYNNAPCGYHSIDGDARFVAINDTELNWLEYTREEVIGRMVIYDVLEEESAELIRRNFPEFKKRGTVKERRLTMVSKTGRKFPTLLNSVAIYDNQGNYVASRSTIFDITEQVKNEQALKEAKLQADESAHVKEQFLANMSHEIRTPINSVIGFTNLLQKTSLTDDQKQFVNLIQSASENLLTIINDILDISKIEAGMLRIEKNPFSLRGLCSSVETMFYHKAREKNLSFSICIQENIPDTLTGDPVRLTQILVNLISNAIKFTQKGGITINITSLKQTDDFVRVRFSVKDSGIGIAPDKLETVFERFQQGETDTTRKYGGTGLGLAIVRNLIQMQGGTITVDSELDKGTEFIFEIEYSLLPIGQATPAMVLPEKTDIGPDPFPGVKILVVEDNPMNQLLIKYTFQGWNVNFELADNGRRAIEWLQRDTFHLVLLDIQMPQMDGYATAQAIRKELKSDIPIIAMTAHALAGEREKCLSHGMNDYISKPIHEKELYNLLHKYLQNGNKPISSLRNELHYIDLNFLEDMVMGSVDFLKTIIKQFLKQFPGEMEALKNAVDSKDNRQVASLAHHIQSTVSILGKNTPFFQQLEKIEKLAQKNTSAKVLNAEFDKLNDYKHSLVQEVQVLLNAKVF